MAVTDLDGWRAPGAPVPPAPPSPELAAAMERVAWAYDELLAIDPAGLSDADVARLVEFTTRLADRSAAAVTTAVGEADTRRLGDVVGARHTGQWLARTTGLTRAEANRVTHLARRLGDEVYAPVRDALAAGGVHADQAGVIVAAVDAIPHEHHKVAPQAVEHLLGLAADHDAKQLKALGRRILDIVAPEVGEAAEAKALAAEEAAAARKVFFATRDHGDGTASGRFTLPTAAVEMLRKQLLAFAAPKHQAATRDAGAEVPDETPDRDIRPLSARLGSALIDWIERYPADRLPSAGGVSATVVVTMSMTSLLGGVAAASLDTGARISAGEARRLACEAGIIPVVLGGRSQVLDLGRKRRFHTKAQRIAIAQRDGGCTAEGCDLPPAACHVHHDQPWSHGGPTDTTSGRLLCHRHHRLIHDPRYDTTHHPGGKVSFHMRT